MSFTQCILANQPIEVFSKGRMARDFTFTDDIVNGIVGARDRPPEDGGHRLLNIGNSHLVGMMTMTEMLERALGREAVKITRPMQPGDVTAIFVNVSRLHALTGYRSQVMIVEGLNRFVAWYRDYYRG